MTNTQNGNVSTNPFEQSAEVQEATLPAAAEVQEATPPSAATVLQSWTSQHVSVGVQAEPSQNDNERVASMLRLSFLSMRKMEKKDRELNNFQPIQCMTSTDHAQVMGKIDAHFLRNTSQTVDPHIVMYITKADTNSMTRLDKMRYHFMSLEIERVRTENERKNLRLTEAPVSSELKKMTCMVCFDLVHPMQRLSFGKCGHLTCSRCMVAIFDTPTIGNQCGTCRKPIAGILDTMDAYFKFNGREQPICRFCFHPFNDDNVKMLSLTCGHVYHEGCLAYNGNVLGQQCMTCGSQILNLPKQIFARWE